MKTKFRRIGKSSLSVLLTVMMLVSTIIVATVPTVNAATNMRMLGNMCSWDTNDTTNLFTESYNSDGDKYYKIIKLTNGDEFKLYDGSWYGTNSSTSLTSSSSVQYGTGETNFKWGGTTGTYKVCINTSTKYIWFEDAPTSTEKELYLYGDYGLGNTWSSATSGLKFEYDSTNSVYYLNDVTFTKSGSAYFRVYNETNIQDLGGSGSGDVLVSNNTWTTLSTNGKAFYYAVNGSKNVNIEIKGDLSQIKVTEVIAVTKYSISAASGNGTNGTVTTYVNGTAGTEFVEGDELRFDITAMDGYLIDSVTIGGSAVTVPTNSIELSHTVDSAAAQDYTYKVTYKADDRPTYTVTVDNSAVTNGSISASTTSAREGRTVTITGNPDTDYTLETVTVTYADSTTDKIFDAKDGGSSGNTATFTMPAQNVTVTATFMESPYIRVDYSCSPQMGSIKVNGAVPTEQSIDLKAGESVTLEAVAASGYQFSYWDFSNVNLKGEILNGNNVESTTSNPATEAEMNNLKKATKIRITPNENISIDAVFTVYLGELMENMRLIFSKTESDLNNSSNTGGIQASVPVYQIATDVYRVQFSATDVDLDNFENTNYYAGISNSASVSGLYFTGGDDTYKNKVVSVKLSDNTVSNCHTQNNGNYNYVFFTLKNSETVDVVTLTIYTASSKYDSNGNESNSGQYNYKYTVSATSKIAENTIKVYAKDGTVGSSTAGYGETTIVNGTGLSTNHGDYITYYAKENERITAQTVVNTDYAKKGYYVYAYVINGKKYDVVETAANTYQMARPYVMGTDSIEITPVYYNRNIDKNGDYITLYIDASTLGDHWGNTIAIYSYYYDQKTGNGTVRGDGDYPGQPMMLDASGYYVAKISKYAYINGVKQSAQKISGMTINNYYERESVHQKFLDKDSAGNSQKHNYQSYDYDDFVYIADMGCDTLRFDMKYKKFSPTNQSAVVSNGNNAKSSYLAPSSSFNIASYFGTYSNGTVTGGTAKYPWEYLRDFDGNLASILGYTDNTIPSASGLTQLERDNPLRIVSVGNQYTNMGEWSTVWYVYDHNNALIAKGLPSDFIPRVSETETNEYGTPAVLPLANQTDAYKAIVYKGYQYKTAFITYESEQSAGTSHDSANSGTRLDGRWYYTRAKAQVTLETGIIYTAETDEAKWSASNFTGWTVDTYADATTTVGTTTNANVTVNGERSVKVNRNTVVDVAATHGKAYKFVGWATANDDGTYTISDTFTAMQSTYTVSLDKKIFAVYVPVSAGSLLITHSKFTGEGANNGVGSYFVSAVVTHKNDQTTTIDLSEDSCIIPSIKSDDQKVVITLKTVSNANSTFNYFYRPNGSGGFNKDKSKDDDDSTKVVEPGFIATEEDPATITYEIPISNIFNGTTQLLTTINFYSDLSRPEIKDTIKFSHDLYADAPKDATGDPEANNGEGTPYIQVTIKEGNNVIYTSNNATTETVEIKASDIQDIIDKVYAGSAGNYTVEVTLTTPDSDQLTTVYRNDYTHTAVDENLYNYIANDTEDTWTVNTDEIADNKVVYTYNFNSLFKYEDGKFSYNANNIKFYSDLSIAATCTITYKYVDRFGTATDAPNKEYIVKLPLGKDCYVNKVYTLDCDAGRKLIKDNAPAINDLFKDCTWDITKAVINGVEATLVAVHKVNTYTVTFKTNPNQTQYTVVSEIPYNSYLVKEEDKEAGLTYCYTADKTYIDPVTGEEKSFSYWAVYDADSVKEGDDGELDFENANLVAKCQTLGFKLRIVDDYYLIPVYGDDKNQNVSISNAFYTREQTKDADGNVTDYLYADFIVAFMDKANVKLAKDDPNESRYQTGLIVAMDPSKTLQDGNINSENKAEYSDITFFIGGADAAAEEEYLKADIRARVNAKDSVATGEFASVVKNVNGSNQKMQHIMIDNAGYNNFNRLDYYLRYKNTETNQNLVMKAFYYVYDKTTGEITISNGVYYNLYDIANEGTLLA